MCGLWKSGGRSYGGQDSHCVQITKLTLLHTKGLGRAGMRIARWSARLLYFTYDVVYRAGAQNYAADCLSRLPLPSEENAEPVTEPELVALLDTELKALSVKDFAVACKTCPELTAIRAQIKK